MCHVICSFARSTTSILHRNDDHPMAPPAFELDPAVNLARQETSAEAPAILPLGSAFA